MRGALLVLAVALTTAGTSSPAKAVDLHAYWDNNCSSCHGHAGPFARQFLTVKDSKLQGRHHVDNLGVFLSNHYLRRDLVVPVIEMLTAQATTEPRFRNECGRCHQTAAALARESLAFHDGVLVSRNDGRSTAGFLSGHARMKAEDVPFFVEVLSRVLKETGAY